MNIQLNDADLDWFYMALEDALVSRDRDRIAEIEYFAINIFESYGLESCLIQDLTKGYKFKNVLIIQQKRVEVLDLLEQKGYEKIWNKRTNSGQLNNNVAKKK